VQSRVKICHVCCTAHCQSAIVTTRTPGMVYRFQNKCWYPTIPAQIKTCLYNTFITVIKSHLNVISKRCLTPDDSGGRICQIHFHAARNRHVKALPTLLVKRFPCSTAQLYSSSVYVDRTLAIGVNAYCVFAPTTTSQLYDLPPENQRNARTRALPSAIRRSCI